MTSIQPYLGELGHLIIINHNDPDVLYHAHPITSKLSFGEVTFEGMFALSGRYTLYAQFDVAGTVYTFPITVDVQ